VAPLGALEKTKMTKCIQNFSWEPEGKKPFVRTRYRWKDIITLNLQETMYASVE
jgi:hypothetical protein